MPPSEPDPADVLVIGGGITGLCCALALAEAGARTRVVDHGLNAGSNANAGSLHVQLQSRLLRLFPALAANVEASLPLYLEAVAEWARLDRRFGPFELVREGGLMLAETPDQLAFLEAKAAREKRLAEKHWERDNVIALDGAGDAPRNAAEVVTLAPAAAAASARGFGGGTGPRSNFQAPNRFGGLRGRLLGPGLRNANAALLRSGRFDAPPEPPWVVPECDDLVAVALPRWT